MQYVHTSTVLLSNIQTADVFIITRSSLFDDIYKETASYETLEITAYC